MNSAQRSPEEKARSKRVHALVMMVLGAIMAACALAAGLIALRPGAFPAWMTGGWRRQVAPAPLRTPARLLVEFEPGFERALARARREDKLVLLHLTAFWSREGRVMEETTYADPMVAAFVRAALVPAAVDADERPELLARYGVGAWPSTALLLPDGRAVASAARLTPGLFVPWAKAVIEGLRRQPRKADSLAAFETRRRQALQRLPSALPGPDDPIWGGAYRAPGDFAKRLVDQAALVRSGETARVRAALLFVERFLTLPGAGYAASMRGEVEFADGRVEEGFSYFAKDDARRRAAGLPEIDRRLFAGPNREMAQAILAAAPATPAQKKHARRTLGRLAALSR